MAQGDKGKDAEKTDGSDKAGGRSVRFFSYFEGRRTRKGVPTPHLMEELSAHKTDRPLWSRAFGPLGFTAVMLALGCGCVVMGDYVIAVIFALCGIVPTAAIYAMAWRALPAVLGPQRNSGAEELGPYLGGGGDERVRQMSPGLMGKERDVMEWNRAEEAQRTFDWLHGLPVGFEDVEVTSDDGVRLAGHALACCPGSPRWVVFAHGYNDNWRAGLAFARHYAEKGCNLLLVDLRAHGASGGAWVGAGWLDRRDLVAWARWVVGRAGSDARIALAGISMGAASAILACAEDDLPAEVRACVADSAYTDFWNTAVGVVSSGSLGTQPMPAHPLVDLARLFLRLRKGGYDVARSRPVDAIAKTRVPVLLLQGADDKVVPSYMADELAAAAGERVELVTVESAGHCCAAFADPGRYWEAVGAFLDRTL